MTNDKAPHPLPSPAQAGGGERSGAHAGCGATSELGGGEAERNPLGGKVAGRQQRDLNSIIAVMQLAVSVAQGDARRATLLSVDETRAIAQLAAMASLVVAKAAALFAASDRGAGKDETAALMADLATVTRPFMGPSSPLEGEGGAPALAQQVRPGAPGEGKRK